MIIVFGCNRSWISRMIRWRTGSKWSHVAILDTDDVHVIEAKGGFGVLRSDLREFEARYREIEYREIDGDIERAIQLIGKPFDNEGIKGVFFRSFKHCPDSWFCSELVAHSTSFIPDEFAQYQTPETLYRLSRQCTKSANYQWLLARDLAWGSPDGLLSFSRIRIFRQQISTEVGFIGLCVQPLP